MAHCRFLSSDLDSAERSVDACLKLDPNFAQAYVVQSQISYARNDWRNSLAMLEQARAIDFDIKNTPCMCAAACCCVLLYAAVLLLCAVLLWCGVRFDGGWRGKGWG